MDIQFGCETTSRNVTKDGFRVFEEVDRVWLMYIEVNFKEAELYP